MSDSIEITHLKVKIQELEKTMLFARTAYSTQARNALTALEDGDEQECIDTLKGLSGDREPSENNPKCGECGSTDLEWGCTQNTNSGVVDGRLKLNEVQTIFYLGCNFCSETVKTVNADEIAIMLTDNQVWL
jgi:hypothetical protein